ncbi:hypothetical protein G5714_002511 [Onychostoma macrolepis]|uniref:Uncharacterized protein n=1 Tax=Onychostoma macrolepis TaxID=369639 RepID=A0A7J6D799_9TELE|nr:hypothetical protein G5714_002511 [Onychostoma macrolepis]
MFCDFLSLNLDSYTAPKYLCYNVHCLLHQTEDAKHHSVLDNFSAFKYEDHLNKLKRLLRKPTGPLSQIITDAQAVEVEVTTASVLEEDGDAVVLLSDTCKEYNVPAVQAIDISVILQELAITVTHGNYNPHSPITLVPS